MATDFQKYCDLETHLFETVGPNFRRTGQISPIDFYLILIWKANRAKNYPEKRFAKRGVSFKTAIEEIAKELHKANDSKEKLKILKDKWGFPLPTATAILSVLYPETFSVYDRRVVEQIASSGGNGKFFERLGNWVFSDKLWEGYQKFLDAVEAITPKELSLRNKDRFLWGKSFFEQIPRRIRD